MKRYCQTLDLKEDEQLIKEYCYWHSPEHIWPEIPEGIRAVGILNMEIYRLYARKHILRRDETDYKLLTVPGLPMADYHVWHAGEVEGLPQLT